MAGKTGKKAKANDRSLSKDFFEALTLFEQDRGIPAEYMIDKLKTAITHAIKKNNNENDDVIVRIEPELGIFEVLLNKVVSEEVEDPCRQILLEDARKINRFAQLGEKVGVNQDPREVGRIAAQAAKQILRQSIRDHEKNRAADEMRSHSKELVTAEVDRVDGRSGTVYLKIGAIDVLVPLPKKEQIEGEVYSEGDFIKVYVVDTKDDTKGTRVSVSRTHPGLIMRLMEKEIPEIYDGTVQIKNIAREAGSRTKVAVYSTDPAVDPVGSCIGKNRSRIDKVREELGEGRLGEGKIEKEKIEKIDIIKYSENPAEYISNALSPAAVLSVTIDEGGAAACHVRVPDDQLSLAIGHKGQNARLAARLTSYKIDIRAESDVDEEPEADAAESEESAAPVEAAENVAEVEAAENVAEGGAAEDVAEGGTAEDVAAEVEDSAEDEDIAAAEDEAAADGE